MHGVTINPVAFLVISQDNVRLIPVNHSSSLDRLIDYMPDLIEKTNKMMNRCIQNKKETTEKIISQMAKKNKKTDEKNEEGMENRNDNVKGRKNKTNLDDMSNVSYEFEYNETPEVHDEDDEI